MKLSGVRGIKFPITYSNIQDLPTNNSTQSAQAGRAVSAHGVCRDTTILDRGDEMLNAKRVAAAVAAMAVLVGGPSRASEAEAPTVPATRPFRMGFTCWPADLTLEGFLTAQAFAHAHGDIVSVMFIGGVPWPEALEGRPFSKDVDSNLRRLRAVVRQTAPTGRRSGPRLGVHRPSDQRQAAQAGALRLGCVAGGALRAAMSPLPLHGLHARMARENGKKFGLDRMRDGLRYSLLAVLAMAMSHSSGKP